ncbi:MAG TPA: zinc ABC transporter substrate-binding protein [Desulfobacterales bacterium]|nr:zinc ABC transporter substrate-binding protein [Desulfobacterales bacterium]
MGNMLKALLLSFLAGFIAISNASAADRVSVFVSILPQKFFVEQIGKDLIDIQVMVEPGASPATYEPKPAQMAAISKASIYFSIGVPFEKGWLKKIVSANPGMRIVHTEHGIQKMPMTAHHNDEEKNHETGNHNHRVLDPHVWLSPPLVMVQARNILTALQEIDPTHHLDYENNYKIFVAMIVDLDAELRDIFAGKQGLPFMVFHPAWGYFAHAYGLKQVPIEIEGKEPKPAQLKKLIDCARERNIKVVFVQPQFSSKSAEQLAKQIGGRVAFVDPLALNWAENLREVAAKFEAILK